MESRMGIGENGPYQNISTKNEMNDFDKVMTNVPLQASEQVN